MAGVKKKSGGARIGSGRKTLPETEKRSITVSFRLNEVDKERLDDLRKDKSVSDFIKEILRELK